jgi:hypothetical protein
MVKFVRKGVLKVGLTEGFEARDDFESAFGRCWLSALMRMTELHGSLENSLAGNGKSA